MILKYVKEFKRWKKIPQMLEVIFPTQRPWPFKPCTVSHKYDKDPLFPCLDSEGEIRDIFFLAVQQVTTQGSDINPLECNEETMKKIVQ